MTFCTRSPSPSSVCAASLSSKGCSATASACSDCCKVYCWAAAALRISRNRRTRSAVCWRRCRIIGSSVLVERGRPRFGIFDINNRITIKRSIHIFNRIITYLGDLCTDLKPFIILLVGNYNALSSPIKTTLILLTLIPHYTQHTTRIKKPILVLDSRKPALYSTLYIILYFSKARSSPRPFSPTRKVLLV